MNFFPLSSVLRTIHALESWWAWGWGEGLLEMQISGPHSRPTKQEGGESGVHKQGHSGSHAYQGLRSADLILNIL